MAEQVGDDKVPGLVALVARGDQVHVRAQGSLSIGGPPVARDSLFRIASTTEPVAAATALALIGEGLIGLDDPVDELLPELAAHRVLRNPDGPLDDTVPASRSITTRDLLTFTFGFGMVSEMFMSPTPWPVVAAAYELPLGTWPPRTGQPRTAWWSTTSRTASGATRRRSATPPPGWSEPSMTCWRSPGCCCAAVHRCGWDGGLGTSWLVAPGNDLTVIVLTQRMFESSDLPPTQAAIQAAAYRALA